MPRSAQAQAAQGPPLAQLQFDIVGVRLVVDPPVLTVPKQIATQINTSLVLPSGAGAGTADAIAALTQGALVEGTLRGPHIPPTRITARPGQPLPLPAFALPGDYFLDGLRLVKDGVPLLDATAQDGSPATTIPIAVIDQIMVTSVTSRPLSLDEIRERGIIIDQTNFQTVNFQVAFNIDGTPFTIQMPVALPTRELLNTQASREEIIERLRSVNHQLAEFQQATLPPEFDRPGLNFSIAPLPLFPVPEDNADPTFTVPPVTGLIVIPGNVAFLNQFFSVVLMVNNVAPHGTPLVLRDVRGTVQLPPGLDRVPGVSYEDPGDDPLRLARLEGVGQQATVRVVQAGPDGLFGTADDLVTIPPQKSGEGEFLLEGLKEGGHLFDIVIDAVLDGLPSGPVSLVGQAAGAVFVRNPTFAVTLAHPRTVRSGEPYDIYATVTNTSRSVANLVSINLDPLGISGAQLVSDPTVSFDTLPAGQAVTARFRLIAQQTGEVTASSFTGETGGGIRLFTGVDERGVPLAPNAIVLPVTANALPDALVAAAQRVLGQAFSIATAPAEALPPDVRFVRRQTVIDRGRDLGQAGQRLAFGDTLPRVVRDLLIDWLGSDDGFDQIMLETDAGRALLTEVGAILGLELVADPIAARQALVAQVAAEPLAVVDVVQLESSFFEAPGNIRDPATYGLLVGVLFNKPVTKESVEHKANYQVEANTVIGAAQQGGGRLVYLYLERPVGGFVPRALSVSGVLDAAGHALPGTTRPIRMVLHDGALLAGQVREATGSGVPSGFLSLVMSYPPTFAFTIATVRTDAQGSFAFDFVPRTGGTVVVTAQHPQTLAMASLSARIRGLGETLLLNPTFLGSGTVRGRVLASDGLTPVPNANVQLNPGSVQSAGGYQARTNALGAFTFSGVPVGVFTLRAIDGASRSGRVTSVLQAAGAEAVADVVLADDVSTGGRLVGRVFLSDGMTPAAGFTVYVGSYSRGTGEVRALDRTTTDASGSFAFASPLPVETYDVVAADMATGQIGSTNVALVPLTTTAVSIVLESTGAVEGVVFDAGGQPVPGALVAGGATLATTDAGGFFRIEGVPAGPREIQAGHPVTRRRGDAQVVVLPGQTVTAAITLEARATITGRVLDANGNPVPRASVRIPGGGGFVFVIANNQGVYTFPDMPLGDYTIQAPGPSADALIEWLAYYGYDPDVAFTSGDGPGGPAPPPSSGDANAVIAAYQNAVQAFFRVDESLLGLPDEDRGGFGWNRVRLFQDNVTEVADVRFLEQGTVSGRTLDANGNPTGALVRVSALKVSNTGSPGFGELQRLTSDAATGEFSFGGIARFDLATFQAAGVRAGDFTLQAAHQFSPVIVQHRDQLNTANPDLSGIELRFPAPSETNGTASGVVLMPDGITPAPAGTTVAISFGDLTVTTNAEGRFVSLLPIPAGSYRFTAQTPSGLRGQATASVPAGGSVDVTIRLLGLGSLVVEARRSDGQVVTGAAVRVRRGTFPLDQADGVTDATGERRFVNLTEGPFSVEVEEALTGLRGRASGTIVRDGEVTSVVTITASGRVTGTFLTAADSQPIPFAQVTLGSGPVQAYATTDIAGRFELTAIPVGPFTVEAGDPASGRLGRAQGQLLFEGQTVDVTVVQLPRGTVAGYVLNADGVTGVGGANVAITSSSFVPTSLQVTARADGSFRIEGVPAGAFHLRSLDPVSGARGEATGTLAFEGEIVDRNIVLEPFGAIRVTVLSETGQPAPNARVTVAGREAAVDVNGQFTFENLRLGTYSIAAVSLADQFNGGAATADIDEANEIVEVTVTLRGVAPVTVRVLASNGVTPVASARVRLHARGGFAGEPAGPTASTLEGFTDGAGQVTFQSVPLGEYFATGESGPLAGVATGSTSGVGQPSQVTIVLGASGAIQGRVLLPGGMTPAFRALVTLEFTSQSGLQSGVLQVTTDLTGQFSFVGIPLGTFTLGAFEVVSTGVRSVTGTLAADGQVLDLGDLTLDNTGPRIVSVSPPDGSTNADPLAPVVLTFSEPMLAASVTPPGVVRLMTGTTSVPGTVALSADRQIATFTPQQPLASSALYTITVAGAPAGPRDESDLPMVDAFVSTFRVRDAIPPAIVSVFPVVDAREVVPEAVVRVTFSEPVASANVVLRTAAGVVVPAQAAFAAGGTAVVLSPVSFLPPNATFVTTVNGAVDTAGNVLPGAPYSFTFHTVDTLAPLVTALAVQGAPRAGATVTLVPTLVGDDVARVEYVAGETGIVSATAPFSAVIAVPTGVGSFVVVARAVDQAGNRSGEFVLSVGVEANDPPTVQLVNVSGQTEVPQGAALAFDVVATDDVGVARVLLSAVGAVTASFDEAIAGAPPSVTQRFTVNVPADAAPGAAFTVQAAAFDAAGQASAPALLALSIRDGVPPVVAITAPADGVEAIPGQTLTVVVTASDSGGVASMTLTCNPVLTGCETRQIGQTSTTQTFTVDVPATLHAPASILLSASATDAAGNIGQAGRVVTVADVVAPVLAALQPVSGSTNAIAGETATLRADATDNVAVVAVDYETSGAVTVSGSAPVTPPATPASVSFGIAVPFGAPNGGSITVRARARDAAGNLSDEMVLLLTIGDTEAPVVVVTAPADGTVFTPGQTIVVQSSATDDVAVAQIVVSARGVVTFDEVRTFTPAVTPAQAAFTIPADAETTAGDVTITVHAVDAAGNPSADVVRVVAVRDATGPAVAVTSPAAGAQVDPRDPLAVVVEASDAVGVAEVGVTTSGVLVSTTTRAVSPARPSATETFTLTFDELPTAGGSLTLTGTARDSAGNQSTSAPVTVTVLDVVAPLVTAVTPADAATGVDTATSVHVVFSEPMDRASLTAAAIRLSAGVTPVSAVLAVAADDRSVTLTPSAPLAENTIYTVTVDTTVRDRAANPLAAAFVSTFRTVSPDATAPQVVRTDPVNGAIGVGTTTPFSVTFTEAIAPASVTASSFRLTTGGAPVAGTFAFADGGSTVRFAPAAPLPFEALVVVELTGDITDLSGNRLVNADGSTITVPITFTYLTGAFAIVRPSGTSVLEESAVTLEAQGAASLAVASVVFSVNGVALPAVTAPPFERIFVVPGAASTPSIAVVASARNASNVEIARAERTYAVASRLRATPSILGLPRGGSGTIRLSIAEPLPAALTITLISADASVATVSPSSVILPAGQTSIAVTVTACASCPGDPAPRVGAALGNTAIVASSDRGTAAASVSVSDPIGGQELSPFATSVGVGITLPPSAGQILATAGQVLSTSVAILSEPPAGTMPVSVTSSNPAVATATATPIAAGQQTTTLAITTGVDGVAVLTIRAGDEVRSVTVIVGTPPPNQTPVVFAPAVGVAVTQAPSAGQILTTPGQGATTVVAILSSPAGATTPVTVESSNAAVATATAAPVASGQQTTTLTITTGEDGVAVLTIRAGNDVRSVTVFVGTPPANATPVVFAQAVGMAVTQAPSAGQILTTPGQGATTLIAILSSPAGAATPVTVESSHPAVASATATPIAAGQQTTTLTIATGEDGVAVLTIRAGNDVRSVTVFVGTPPANQTPVVFAPPVGLSVIADPGAIGRRVIAPAGVALTPTIGVQLLTAPLGGPAQVTVTTSDPSIVSLGASSTITLTLNAGDLVLPVTFGTIGTQGSAVLTFEVGGVRRELLVVVGSPPASQLPAVVAPVVGVQVP